jgi:hypothetical protein
MKFRPVGAELFHADWWTDRRDEANIRNFAKAPKNETFFSSIYVFHESYWFRINSRKVTERAPELLGFANTLNSFTSSFSTDVKQ